ncbi:MAG: LamG domain-containing protein, partial [Planctomycetota bacterium]
VLSLDGLSDYVRVENNDVAEFSTESFTYTFWVKTGFTGDWYAFWKGVDYSGVSEPDDLHGVNLWHDNDSPWVRFSLYNYGGPGVELKSRTDVPDTNCITGQWVHIACVREASINELRFYINGELEPPGGGANPAEDECKDISNPGHLYIGCNDRGYPPDTNSSPTFFWNGGIDDFRVYNHALSEQEIGWLANNTDDPNLASEPSPRDGAHDVCPGVKLYWTAGENVVDHNVYFGTSLSDVNASATAYLSHYGSNSISSPLEYGTTYYWRIDEVGATEVWKGYIWKFTTNDGNAFDPYPADEQTLVPLNPTLYWSPGCLAASHEIYFGTDYNEVDAAEDNSEPNVYYEDLGDVNTYDACAPDYSSYYYWRVDEVNGLTTWRGEVLTFKTEGAIVDPNLMVWYKLDETEGTDVPDSSGREYDGLANLSQGGRWDANGYYDGCFFFDDDSHIFVPTSVIDEINKEITIAVWLNNGTSERDDNVVCSAGWGEATSYMRISVPDEDSDVSWRAGDDTNDVLTWNGGNPEAWEGEWNHFGFVKNENTGEMQIYLNGLPVAEHTDANADTLAELHYQRFKIAAETESFSGYQGSIDEFRVYDRALTADEIAAIFRGGDLELAWGPSPYNGEDEVPYDVVLKWKPGDYADSHDVFIGTNWDDINDVNSSNYASYPNVDYNHTDACNYDPGLLDLSQMYYWRVDEVNDSCDASPWKGKIWKFTVAGYVVIDDMEDYTGSWAGEGDHPLDEGWADY